MNLNYKKISNDFDFADFGQRFNFIPNAYKINIF